MARMLARLFKGVWREPSVHHHRDGSGDARGTNMTKLSSKCASQGVPQVWGHGRVRRYQGGDEGT